MCLDKMGCLQTAIQLLGFGSLSFFVGMFCYLGENISVSVFFHQLQRGRQGEKEQEIEEARLREPVLGPQSTPGIQENALFCFYVVLF